MSATDAIRTTQVQLLQQHIRAVHASESGFTIISVIIGCAKAYIKFNLTLFVSVECL